jgi:Fe2+ or Zn2+ uptake regulation protein
MECEVCDLDPNKICDNCGKCLEIHDDAVIYIDKIIEDKDEREEDNQ